MIIKNAITLATITAMTFGIAAYSYDDRPKNPIDPSPVVQIFVNPPDGATNQPLRLVLNWPGDSAVSFDHFQLFFGLASPPPLIDSSMTDTFFVTQPLLPDTSYFWMFVAVSDSGILDSSLVSSFKTTSGVDARQIATFPLPVGVRWSYQGHIFGIDLLTGDSSFSLTTISELSVDSTTSGSDSTVLHALKQKMIASDGYECEENMFFENTADGLFFHGSDRVCGVGPFPMKPVPQSSLYFHRRIFNSPSELFAYILPDGPLSGYAGSENQRGPEYPPVLSLKYPLQIGQRWTYREPGNPFAIDKLVSFDETLTTGAGTFECLRVQWLHDLDADGSWDGDIDFRDWIAEEGLIRREIIVREVLRTDVNGEVVGVEDYFRQHTLTDIQISPGCCATAGDANNDNKVNIADVQFVISWLFTGASAPTCFAEGSADGDDRLNIADVTYVISWLFSGGPDPECGPAEMGR